MSSATAHAAKKSAETIPEIKETLGSLEAPTDISWESVSEKITSEIKNQKNWLPKGCLGSWESHADSIQPFASNLH